MDIKVDEKQQNLFIVVYFEQMFWRVRHWSTDDFSSWEGVIFFLLWFNSPFQISFVTLPMSIFDKMCDENINYMENKIFHSSHFLEGHNEP